MWIGLAIWLAKLLISHFLDSQIALKRQLQDAVDLQAKYNKDLADVNAETVQLQVYINAQHKIWEDKNKQLIDIALEIDKANKERDEKLKELDSVVDSMSDADVVTAPIGPK